MLNDNEIRIFLLTAVSIMLMLVVFILLFIHTYYKKQIAFYREKQALKLQYQKEMMKTRIEISEQTMKYVSQEIHDNIGQTLTLAKLNLNTLDPSSPEQNRAKVKDCLELVTKAIADLRALSKTLQADNIVEGGLVKAVEFEMQRVNRYTSLTTTMDIKGTPARMDDRRELVLFRIVQEAMNNTVKHAHASAIHLDLSYAPSLFRLSLRDDGEGMQLKDNDPFAGGSGLKNMRSRAEMIGGKFRVNSKENGGTEIEVELAL